MFTLDQIKSAHAKVKTGADFPAYVQDLIKLGVIGYETWVADGHTVYAGKNDFTITSPARYDVKDVMHTSNAKQFIADLKHHQQGGSDFATFSDQCAANGVERWVLDFSKMTCTYYDEEGEVLLEEKIPT
ncbi:MAG TPA: DUF1398 family protein [Flavobacteriales bacterium]|nr:DUF1398 family protein [Flavobacteriales bacterium]